jgi:hypothetical protein
VDTQVTTRLVHVDLRGIQRFVFASAQLRDVVGRSAMVRHVVDPDHGPLADAAGVTGAQVMSAAGGRCVVRCPDDGTARAFATHYSGALLRLCRDLDPVITQVPVTDSVALVLGTTLATDATRTSGEWSGRGGILGLTITQPCAATGLPAEETDTDPSGSGRPAEQVTTAVLNARDLGRRQATRFRDMLLPGDGFDFPAQMDDLGRSVGSRSLVGVVHLDLDGLGSRLAAWLKSLPANANLDDIRIAETQIDEFVTGLARHIVQTVGEAVDHSGPALTGRPDRLEFALPYVDKPGPKQGTIMLPVRPVLAGGDDLTVLCDGRLAWSVVAAAFDYLTTTNNPPKALHALGPMWTEPLTACAGVAVVSSGYPLSAAQQMANGLCGRAKREARSQVDRGGGRECHVSWHRGDHTADMLDTHSARVYSASRYRVLLREFLDPAIPTSLRGTRLPDGATPGTVPWSGRRTWLRSRLGPVLERTGSGAYRTARALLRETAHIHGTITLPGSAKEPDWGEMARDALDLLDRHLELSPEHAP